MQVMFMPGTCTVQEAPMRRAAGRGAAPSTSTASPRSCTRASGAALDELFREAACHWLLDTATEPLHEVGTIMKRQPRNPVQHSFRRLGAGPRQQQPQEDAISQPVIEVQCAATADAGALPCQAHLKRLLMTVLTCV